VPGNGSMTRDPVNARIVARDSMASCSTYDQDERGVNVALLRRPGAPGRMNR
jgi:hypothetical protein